MTPVTSCGLPNKVCAEDGTLEILKKLLHDSSPRAFYMSSPIEETGNLFQRVGFLPQEAVVFSFNWLCCMM
jgi:hypothetical protein